MKGSDTAQMWIGGDFTFRAVGGKFTILVYGSHVNLVAAGTGKVARRGHARHADRRRQVLVERLRLSLAAGRRRPPRLLIGSSG